MTSTYRTLFDTVLTRLPPERAHALALGSLDAVTRLPGSVGLLRRLTHIDDELIRVRALGRTFPSPLGVAAGLDKDAQHVDGLGALGFGFVEVGTLTPRAQAANPPPILARLPGDRALLNRMGFPNQGAEAAARRLATRRSPVIVGANVGKNRETELERAAADYVAAATAVAPHADYLVLNVSSPNTPGLRDLQAVGHLRPLIEAVRDAVGERPVLVKISPDMDGEDLDAVADLAVETGLAGIVATNTTLRREGLRTNPREVARLAWAEGGGISGAPLSARSLEVLRRLRGRVSDRLVLISVGGIESAQDVWERVLAGATLVQVYTGLVYGGPAWARSVNLELARRTWAAGCPSIQDLVGTGAPEPGSDQ